MYWIITIVQLTAACLAEKQQIPILYSLWFDATGGGEPTIYRTRGEHANHYATDAVSNLRPRVNPLLPFRFKNGFSRVVTSELLIWQE